jgi:hypothetical protein
VAELWWVAAGLMLHGVWVFCCRGSLVRSFFWLRLETVGVVFLGLWLLMNSYSCLVCFFFSVKGKLCLMRNFISKTCGLDNNC